jgi:hypothetical protein
MIILRFLFSRSVHISVTKILAKILGTDIKILGTDIKILGTDIRSWLQDVSLGQPTVIGNCAIIALDLWYMYLIL